MENEFEKKAKELSLAELNNQISSESSDITLSVRSGTFEDEGKIHPISGTIDKIISIFSNFGFSVEIGLILKMIIIISRH